MEVNFISIFYLILRLSPFIIVCFFTLQSIFYQDFKGLVYLMGLLLTCAVATMIPIDTWMGEQQEDIKPECSYLLLGSGGKPLSQIPLGLLTLMFTFSYLGYAIVKGSTYSQNIPTFVLFPILISAEAGLNINCGAMWYKLILALILGLSFAIFWAWCLDVSGAIQLQLTPGVSNNEVSYKPSNVIYRCTYL